jgi:3-methylcrotonyl-CoA carboxylase alpha subunit
MNGHAIEARICAENPDKQFLPATGRLVTYRKPMASSFAVDGPERGVRIDDGVREGDAITPYYDSMIAKLIVHGDTREQALARLDQALSELHIVGVANNVAFLRQVVRSPSFAKAQLDTALIEREKAVLFNQQPLPMAWAVASVVAHQLVTEQPVADGWLDPWARTDGWRVQGVGQRQWSFMQAETPWQAQLTRHLRGDDVLRVGEHTHVFSHAQQGDSLLLNWGPHRWHAHVYVLHGVVHVFADKGSCSLTLIDPLAHVSDSAAAQGNLSAPMPGKLLSFAVQVGDAVKAGQALAVMEAMKMEHTVASPSDGTVAELLYAPGDQVTEGAPLLRLAVQAA